MVQAIRSLGELVRHGGTVQATCRRCGRVALFSPFELSTFYSRKRWADDWPGFAERLRCSGKGGCGERRPRVAWLVGDPPTDIEPLPPRPRLVRKPRGAG